MVMKMNRFVSIFARTLAYASCMRTSRPSRRTKTSPSPSDFPYSLAVTLFDRFVSFFFYFDQCKLIVRNYSLLSGRSNVKQTFFELSTIASNIFERRREKTLIQIWITKPTYSLHRVCGNWSFSLFRPLFFLSSAAAAIVYRSINTMHYVRATLLNGDSDHKNKYIRCSSAYQKQQTIENCIFLFFFSIDASVATTLCRGSEWKQRAECKERGQNEFDETTPNI